MKPAFELPDDWFVENDGQRLVLDPEKVKAAFEARVALQGWQPIESAPKDGTNVLIAEDQNGIHGEAYYDDEESRWYWANTGRGDYPDPREPFPTHWQPLPPPPAASDREERR